MESERNLISGNLLIEYCDKILANKMEEANACICIKAKYIWNVQNGAKRIASHKCKKSQIFVKFKETKYKWIDRI